MSIRKLRLDEVLEQVVRTMSLRRPQRESLSSVHELISYLTADLSELSADQIRFAVQELHPEFRFGSDFASLEFALATGVGKTRLMGAIMAYLYRSGQSKHFVVMASRKTILRKLISECHPGSDKYIFVDEALVPGAALWHSGNLDAFSPSTQRIAGVLDGPEIFVLSPQSFVGGDRRAWRTSEFTGTSVGHYLAEQDDLVVLVDEAHHLGGQEEAEARAWTEAVRELSPKIQFGMSATPLPRANLLHSYDLATCLREGLYTKAVRVIVDPRPDDAEVDDVAWDRRTIDFALERLRRKASAIEACRVTGAEFPDITPVLLICADNTAHADEVAEWLIAHRGLASEEILVTHSNRTKTEEELNRLVEIQSPGNKVRVVVNVFELTEGWDVTNVYVVAPLRRLGTFQGAIQTMGRGLRLPAGRRVGNDDLDSLDMLCFGSESLQEILDQALGEFGDAEDGGAPLDVRPVDDPDANEPPLTKRVTIPVLRQLAIDLPSVTQLLAGFDVDDVALNLTAGMQRGAVEFDISQVERIGSSEKLRYDRSVFTGIVTSRVMHGLSFLSEVEDRPKVAAVVDRVLASTATDDAASVDLDPHVLAELVKSWIRDARGNVTPTYAISGPASQLQIGEVTLMVPDDFETVFDAYSISEWTPSEHRQRPIGGWRKCVHEAAAFDSSGEFALAKMLDSAADVYWWFRNGPTMLRINTPLGGYLPDLVSLQTAPGARLLLIQAKGDHLWSGAGSDARIKARAAESYCEAVNSTGATPAWSHVVILQSDASKCQTLNDITTYRVAP